MSCKLLMSSRRGRLRVGFAQSHVNHPLHQATRMHVRNHMNTPPLTPSPRRRPTAYRIYPTTTIPAACAVKPRLSPPQALATHVAAQVAAGIAARQQLNPNAPTFLPTPPTASNNKRTLNGHLTSQTLVTTPPRSQNGHPFNLPPLLYPQAPVPIPGGHIAI